MKKVKSLSDVSIRHVVDMWMREYDFSGKSANELPKDWPVAWDKHNQKLWTGDMPWMEDFIYQMKDGVEIIGTFEEVLDRIKNQSLLKKAIERAEEIREEGIKNFEREYANIQARKKVLEEKLKVKNNPWTHIDEGLPVLGDNSSKEIFKQYLITDGNEVRFAQVSVSSTGDVYLWPVGVNQHMKYTHWMPADRLLIYLEAGDGN